MVFERYGISSNYKDYGVGWFLLIILKILKKENDSFRLLIWGMLWKVEVIYCIIKIKKKKDFYYFCS